MGRVFEWRHEEHTRGGLRCIVVPSCFVPMLKRCFAEALQGKRGLASGGCTMSNLHGDHKVACREHVRRRDARTQLTLVFDEAAMECARIQYSSAMMDASVLYVVRRRRVLPDSLFRPIR